MEAPGDAHIPKMLRPDPLTAHELLPPPVIGSTLQTTQQVATLNAFPLTAEQNKLECFSEFFPGLLNFFEQGY
jgi:hypothetical protein